MQWTWRIAPPTRCPLAKNPAEPAALAKLQRQLLAVGMKLLARGGRLVYSTCSFEREETLANVAWLLENFPLRPVNLAGLINVEPAVEGLPGTLTLFPTSTELTVFSWPPSIPVNLHFSRRNIVNSRELCFYN